MRIVLDAMGSDQIVPDVEGLWRPANTDKRSSWWAMRPSQLDRHGATGCQSRSYTPSRRSPWTIGREVGRKARLSMHIGMRLVKEQADALYAGNTGTVLSIATSTPEANPGVSSGIVDHSHAAGQGDDPADIGANADCRPEWMAQFAVMGSIYAERTEQITAWSCLTFDR